MNTDIIMLLEQLGWRLAVAESCTAGALATAIAEMRGASQVFAGGVVAYQKRTKERVLGVPFADLHGPGGAVTSLVAERVAVGDGDSDERCRHAVSHALHLLTDALRPGPVPVIPACPTGGGHL